MIFRTSVLIFYGRFARSGEKSCNVHCGMTAHVPSHLRGEMEKKMMKNNSKSKNNDMIPVYLTVYYGKKGGKKIYAHSEQAIVAAGGKCLSCWRSLGEPIRYVKRRDAA